MVAKLCTLLIMFFLNSFDLKNDEKIFYAKDRYIEEFIILYSDDNKGIRINLFKDHDWYGQSDFKYILNGDTLRIDLADDKIGNIVLFVKKNKLKKINHDNESKKFKLFSKAVPTTTMSAPESKACSINALLQIPPPTINGI